jgi:hypothetical protein
MGVAPTGKERIPALETRMEPGRSVGLPTQTGAWLLFIRSRLGQANNFRVARDVADSDDVNGPFRRDVNKSERSDAGICNDAGNYSHQSRPGWFLAGMGVWGKGTAFEFPCPTSAL